MTVTVQNINTQLYQLQKTLTIITIITNISLFEKCSDPATGVKTLVLRKAVGWFEELGQPKSLASCLLMHYLRSFWTHNLLPLIHLWSWTMTTTYCCCSHEWGKEKQGFSYEVKLNAKYDTWQDVKRPHSTTDPLELKLVFPYPFLFLEYLKNGAFFRFCPCAASLRK